MDHQDIRCVLAYKHKFSISDNDTTSLVVSISHFISVEVLASAFVLNAVDLESNYEFFYLVLFST